MPDVPAAGPWLALLLLLAVQTGVANGAIQPWHCAPCTPEKLALCPRIPDSCMEISRAAGCGCCPMCALPLGAHCGVATARCARGLSCRALPGETRPLHALTRGQGACMREPTAPPSGMASSAPETPGSTEMTEEQLLESFHLMTTSGEDQPILWNAINIYKGMRARDMASASKWKPCQRELYKVLERLAQRQKAGEEIYKFYLPNCNRHGFYHSKQCESSLDGEAGLCWCVYPWSGRRIPGVQELRGDPDCQQYFNLQN
ncbi:insulin-like growth factor-binding protein 1 isoform X2 [Perognathus longimembris pacificus]|uniref:insulin-like growth factor-binding protein 1 isoform X2 n=1 Tax=Perognathus longimembris pacificus TaxID=214514 RepID=UPI0020194497|nr:insulin-like growth factor-binding protein 1 isoform X2 [Perognathus longimembris pacificus]